MSDSCEIALRWLSLDLTDDKSTLFHVMAWCHQVTSHFPCQCWLRSVSPYGVTRPQWVNSLDPGRCGCNLKFAIFKLIWRGDLLSISCEITLRWMTQDLSDDLSTLVQVMAWCHQATSHYLDQCWPISMMPYGVTNLQWIKPYDVKCG